MAEPGRKWWRRLLLVIAVGPGAIIFAGTADQVIWNGALYEQRGAACFALIGAMWGLTAGILRRSLLKSLLGLHIGAVLGALYFVFWDWSDERAWRWFAWFSNTFKVIEPMGVRVLSRILLAGIFGSVLGAAINFQRIHVFKALSAGALAGLASFGLGAMGCWISEWCVYACLGSMYLMNSSLLFNYAVTFVPVSAGLYLFFWLIADVLPRREAEREKAANG